MLKTRKYEDLLHKDIYLEDLAIKVQASDKTIDLTKNLFIKLEESFSESLWEKANSFMCSQSKEQRWRLLARFLDRSPTSICQRRARTQSKPLITYMKLLKILEDNGVELTLGDLESKLEKVRWKGKKVLKEEDSGAISLL